MPDLNYLARSARRSDKCGHCGGFKRHASIFCYQCWSVIPRDVQQWGYSRMKTRENVHRCLWTWLVKLRVLNSNQYFVNTGAIIKRSSDWKISTGGTGFVDPARSLTCATDQQVGQVERISKVNRSNH